MFVTFSERQNHMNVLLIKGSTVSSYILLVLLVSSISYCGGENISVKHPPWKLIPNVTRKDEERVFVFGQHDRNVMKTPLEIVVVHMTNIMEGPQPHCSLLWYRH